MRHDSKELLEVYRSMKFIYDKFIDDDEIITKTHDFGIRFMRQLLIDELRSCIPPNYNDKSKMLTYIIDFDNMLCNEIITLLMQINRNMYKNSLSYKLLNPHDKQ